MTRALAVGLGVALAASAAAAEPSPAPPAPAPPGAPLWTGEQAGTKLDRDAPPDPGVSADAERAARADFYQGNAHLNNGLFPQAVEKYTAALGHWDHPAIHYNLALALINLDRPLEVFDHLTRAIAYGPDPLEKDKYEHAQQYLRLVGGQLADIEVSCDKPGARVAVDGKEVFVAPGRYATKVRAGKHTFLADKQGYITRSTAPSIGPGETYRIDLSLYTPGELTRYRRRWDRAWLPYTVLGAGALFAIVGGGLELSATQSFRAYDDEIARCSDPATNSGCASATPGLQDLRDSGRVKRTAGLVMYGLAGGAIAIGATLVILNRREAYYIQADELATGPVAVTPLVAPGIAGALVQGHF